MGGSGGGRRRRVELASLALQGPAVPAEQLYGVGSHERHLLAPRQPGFPGERVDAAAEDTAQLAAGLERLLSLDGSGCSNCDGNGKAASSGKAACEGAAAANGRAVLRAPAVRQAAAAAKAANPAMRASFPGGCFVQSAAWMASLCGTGSLVSCMCVVLLPLPLLNLKPLCLVLPVPGSAGAATWLAAHSLYTLGSLAWSTARAAVPAASRRAADAAVALACAAAAAAALS